MQDKKPLRPVHRARRVAGAAAAGVGGLVARGVLSDILADIKGYHFKPDEYDIPLLSHSRMAGDANKVRREMMRTGVRVPMKTGPTSRTFFNPPGIMVDSPNLPTIFHEIGHAHVPVLGKIWQEGAALSRSRGADLLRGGLLLGALSEPADDTGMHAFVNKHAPVMMALSFMPGLLEEGRASLGALKGLKAVGYPAAKGLKSLGTALGTYLAMPVAATAATAIGRDALNWHRKPGEKTATAGVPATPKMSGQLRLSTTQASMAPIGQLKPKTTTPKPGPSQGTFRGIPTAKPPSLSKYYRDATQSMVPGRGART